MKLNWNKILTGSMATIGIWTAIVGGIDEDFLVWLFGGMLIAFAWNLRD